MKKAKQTTASFRRNETHVDGDEAELVSNPQNRPDGHFQSLNIDRSALGFKQLPDQYGVSAYSKKQSSGNGEYLLEPAEHIASRIHVSNRIDVFTSPNDSEARLGIEHV